jgi:quercetin dioxygenase-like cupin family protein
MTEPVRSRDADEYAIYVVAGGTHVTVELDRSETDGVLDAIEVFARPGGGPPPHRHEFAEWFLVREGTLTICEERDGTVVPTREVPAGAGFWVPPGVVHGTLNLTDDDVRFQTVGQPGLMSGYFAEAGVKVTDPGEIPTATPPGPAKSARSRPAGASSSGPGRSSTGAPERGAVALSARTPSRRHDRDPPARPI